MRIFIFIVSTLLYAISAFADEDSRREFIKDGAAIAAKTCEYQTKLDYLSANAALAGSMSGGIRDEAVVVVEKILAQIGADKSSAGAIADRRIDFFKMNIPVAKLVISPGVSGQRYQDCFDQKIRDLNEAAMSHKE